MATHTIEFPDANIETTELTTTELRINTFSVSTFFTLENVTNSGNTTTEVVQFTNPTTGLVTTSNVVVGGDLAVSGNATVTGELDATAIGNNLIDIIYPVGSIYFTASVVSPSTSIGGTWVRYAQGKCLFGVDDADTDFALETTGGEKEHTLTVAEMPSHTHAEKNSETSTHGTTISVGSFPWYQKVGDISVQSGPSGGDQPHENLPPYIAIYIWKRTA
jgi:hypothetical protein